MIYIILFIYYVFLALLYDVGRYRRYRKLHFFVALVFMMLVSGLRYRIGSDTVVYMYDFRNYPDLFHLQWDDFSAVRYDPLWVLLNVCCKTLCNDFFLVQCVVSAIHISIWGRFVKKVCPAFCFSMVLFYYIFEYFIFNMEVMREALAFSFFLLAILALNERKPWKVVLYVIGGFMFHKYSLMVFVLFYCFYKVYTFKKAYILPVVAFFIIMPVIQRDYIYTLVEKLLMIDTFYAGNIHYYATSDFYTMRDYNWKGIIRFFLTAAIYIFMIIRYKNKYPSYINMNMKIFESAIYFSVILIMSKYSFMIVGRLYDYFMSFTSILVIVFFAEFFKDVPVRQKLVLYMVGLVIPVYFCYQSLTVTFGDNPASRRYMIYYPYSSVFNPKEDRDRELFIFNYKL